MRLVSLHVKLFDDLRRVIDNNDDVINKTEVIMIRKFEDVPWGVKKRLQFIEFHLLFKREVNSRTLVMRFGISRQQASGDIKLYRDLYPENLLPYNAADKSYRPSKAFNPHFISESLTPGFNESFEELSDSKSIETIPTLTRNQTRGLLSKIMLAIECESDIQAIYKSASSPFGVKRTLKPCGIAYVGNRPHLRAYCYDHCQFRDFVLSRFSSMPELIAPRSGNAEFPEDTVWQEFISVTLEANPHLCKDGQRLIFEEYDLGKASPISIRKSLLHYFFAHNNMPVNEDDYDLAKKQPWSFPVLAKNWEECRIYLFGHCE
ncbi:WYL domain-containing protein [Vibrio sp. Isolate24]|uniref:WYL domain-containing protein n=1 Tax=Vibrio sp. Isolate24 TaxID=2908534 RepID=UPI001EFE51B5|nr:WYL domain-containing protein [Vibrio sp. Isolate24]MCG9678971.1 WYL domain-containing protein [Vibrio sp. Isolate24]